MTLQLIIDHRLQGITLHRLSPFNKTPMNPNIQLRYNWGTSQTNCTYLEGSRPMETTAATLRRSYQGRAAAVRTRSSTPGKV